MVEEEEEEEEADHLYSYHPIICIHTTLKKKKKNKQIICIHTTLKKKKKKKIEKKHIICTIHDRSCFIRGHLDRDRPFCSPKSLSSLWLMFVAVK